MVAYYTSTEQAAMYAINHIDAYLDDGTIDTTHTPGAMQTQYTPQIIDTAIINDTLNWVRIQGTFTAIGNERLITIGDYFDNAHTHYIAVHDTTGRTSAGGFWAYYLIDDVSVIDCSNTPFAGNDTLITLGDSVFIGSHELLLPYKWYVLGSATPIDSSGGFWAHPTATTSYVLEQNLCGIKKWDTVKVWVAPVGTSILQYAVSNLQIYPNPATNEIIIEHAANCEVVFYDVTGRAILISAITADKQTLDISALAQGVYLAQVTDASTGARTVRTLLKE
jgi:hypothetical protein